MKLNQALLRLTTILGLAVSPVALAGGGKGGEAHFKAMDADGDGKISQAEHTAGATKMFETIDGNKDGRVTAMEMDAAREQIAGKGAKKGDMTSADKIKTIDTNNDGELTGDEHAAGATMMFEKMDTNKDGFVTKQEMSAGHSKMMKKEGKEGAPKSEGAPKGDY